MVKEYYDICKFGCLSIKSTPFHVLQGLAIIMIIEGELKFTTVGNTTMLTEGQIEIINVKGACEVRGCGRRMQIMVSLF